uniref:Uncharacterized protein n=1 Tax=Davidia involucrata TaxID=16924 RepID=A0A5B6YI99_DAVIN
MFQRNTKPHRSVFYGGENAENRVGVAQRKSFEPIDHWDFLDEIEAPMWIDLTLEVNSTYQDINDEWFHISHPFHQHSPCQPISAFSHSVEGCTKLDFGLEGPSSPKLPPSVSRSRGKHYRSREWGRSNCWLTSNKQHPVKNLSSKSSWVNSGSCQKIKSKLSYGNPKGNAGSKASSVCKSSLTETSGSKYSKPISSFGDSNRGESKSTSTITSENIEQQQKKFFEVSSQTFGHTSGLLSTLKITLRKSCVTRQASRAEIIGGRQSGGRKSSSSKSSVGSSSNPGYDVEDVKLHTTQNKDTTPESRNAVRMSEATKNKVRLSNVSKVSTAQVQDMSSKSRMGGKVIAANSIRKETTKSKLQCRTVQAKATVLHRINKQDLLTAATKAKDKEGVSRYNKLPGGGKENAIGRMAVSQKSSARDDAAGGVVQGQKVMKQCVPEKSDRTGLVHPKGKINSRSEGKNSTNVIQKVYLR